MKVLKVSLILAVGYSLSVASGNGVKFYGTKSGKIDYEIKSSGNVMGMGKIETVGRKRLIFDNYGKRKLEEESKVTRQNVMGNSSVEKLHILNYSNGIVSYVVNFEQKQIMRTINSSASIAAGLGGDNLVKKGEEILKKMGGKKIGTDKVAGVSCDVWDFMGIKQCLYEGIPLKIESDMMGVKTLEIATKASFDIDVSDDDFSLPDYTIYQYDMERMMSGGKPEKLDKNKLAQMDKEENRRADHEAEKTKEMMKEVASEGLLPTIKKKMLQQEKLIKFAQKCFKEADSVNEANVCNKRVKEMSEDEDMEEKHFQKWNEKVKNGILAEMERASKAMDCVKKANTLKEIGICTK